MKKVIVPIIFLICLSIMCFIIFINAKETMSEDKATIIGEEKYLKFLWMVDGAFNSDRLNGDFIVNGKELQDEDKLFTCKYQKKNNKECIGNNFDSEFRKLFSSRISIDDVYSDGHIYKWYSYDNGKYSFNNLDNCNIDRMGLNQKLKIFKIDENEIEYKVSIINKDGKSSSEKDFILVLENNEWKISKAYYYDLCGLKYYID